MIGLKLLVSGIVGTVAIGIVLEKTRKYKLSLHIVTFNLAVVIVLMIISLTYYYDDRKLFNFFVVLLGFNWMAFLPLIILFGAELTFPLQPALVSSTLMLIGFPPAFLFSLLGAYITRERKSDELLSDAELHQEKIFRSCTVISMVTITSLIAFGISFFIKEDLKRTKYADQNTNESKEEEEITIN